jgi:hypothetical protein
VRRRVRAFADGERDDHPHLIPNLEPNLSKVPFVSTTSLNSVSASLMFRTWDHFGAENVLYETKPLVYTTTPRRDATSESKGGPDSLMAVQRKGAGTRVFRGLSAEPPIFKGKGL